MRSASTRGRDEAGRRRGRPTEDVVVTDCVVHHGHGGVTIGSEMSGGVRSLLVERCMYLGTDVGLRFKTTRGRAVMLEGQPEMPIRDGHLPARGGCEECRDRPDAHRREPRGYARRHRRGRWTRCRRPETGSVWPRVGVDAWRRKGEYFTDTTSGRMPNVSCTTGVDGTPVCSGVLQQIMGGAPRLAIFGAINDHTAHHRGALTVYARLNGIVPPMPYMDA